MALVLVGALAYGLLPVSPLPQVDFPTVQVTTQLPGASPDVIASLITEDVYWALKEHRQPDPAAYARSFKLHALSNSAPLFAQR